MGTLPPSLLTGAKDLHVFNVGHNLFAGQLPDVFGPSQPPHRLIHFSVQSNQFSGTLPKSLGHITQLRVLEVADNKITGFIPREWSYLTKLEILRLVRTLLVSLSFKFYFYGLTTVLFFLLTGKQQD